MTSILGNHHTSLRSKKAPTQVEETAIPDSTTTFYFPGQDVLLKQKDGRFYLGTVVEVDSIREQCLVKFGDDTDSWSSFKDLTKLSTPEQEDLCVVCKKSAPRNKHEVTVCDKCGRGYHQKCHQPEIPAICQKEGGVWVCQRCIQQEPNWQRKTDYKYLRNGGRKPPVCGKVDKKSLPYNIDELTWDTYHRSNVEAIYCYCGCTGEWYTQMMQCGRCKQWFHEKCVGCLQYPLYCGDRFYVFVCSVCNHGSEFLRRLELKWVDLVHLMLFNLTLYNSKKYYDLDTVIVPYINDNWHALQLPPKISNVSKSERRENILSVLTNNRNRFKCGREIKKRTTIWGLRMGLPPPAPCVALPETGVIREDELRERWQGSRRLQFLPMTQTESGALKKIISTDSEMLDIMMGVSYQHSTAQSETESPCPSPDIEESPIDNKLYAAEYGGGCAKRSVPFPNVSLKHKKRLLARDKLRRQRRQTNTDYSSSKEAPLTPPTSVSAPPTPPASNLCGDTPCDTSGDETSSKSTLDLIIPPPKDFEGKNNPFLTLMKGNIVEPVKKRRSKDVITLPLPLTAVIPVARTMKRQLSEKDICIGPNGEVKRRRLRRTRSNQGYGAPTASKTAAVVPVRPDAKEWGQRSLRSNTSPQTQIGNCVDYALNGRRLRQRPDKSNPPTPTPSPVKQDPDISMDDLKSSVNSYFGAGTRIAAGERFNVKAKRIGPSGKMEFLIEWEGPGNGMT